MIRAIVLLCCLSCISDSFQIISRDEWLARKPNKAPMPLSINPPSHAVIHHSATRGCYTRENCSELVRAIQNFHMNTRFWDDIGYNFLIGGDGNVYEGRGFGVQGAHEPEYNDRSLGICLLGHFTGELPNNKALRAAKNLISYSVMEDKLLPTYKLKGHRQGSPTECPGETFYREIQSWPHWTPNK